MDVRKFINCRQLRFWEQLYIIWATTNQVRLMAIIKATKRVPTYLITSAKKCVQVDFNLNLVALITRGRVFTMIKFPTIAIRPWWRHQMETFSALLAICVGNSPVPGEFPTQRPVTRSFDVFFDLRPNKRLSKQPWGWWSETPSSSLWRHRNATWPIVHLGMVDA